MDELPAFRELLMRLAEVRDLDRETMARQARLPEAEITSVLNGAEPSPDLLRSLAPVLGLHRSDLFVIAGQPVPDDLAPRDASARHEIRDLAWPLTFLPRAVPELYELVRSLPTLPHPSGPTEPAPLYRTDPNTPGGLILRLLLNRNLDRTATAYYLYGIGGGPMLSTSTIYLIGEGRKALTPDLLTSLSAILDVSRSDLGALAGMDLSTAVVRVHRHSDEAAELVWRARRLTAEQLRSVVDRAHEIRHERAGELEPRHRCHCTGRT
ncbi:plasmid maintenance system antidote protein VapI [Actinoplanes tereljensis]|uniref:XRE family transcriptional regulator n=1 Tax=Paractinoplanes tereljensis TaxID=571912 RepID=UPI001944EC3D|nr:XRE family transcriptional regulator [Actinoplanes tereljensis]